jgi:hypothetical protein
LRDHSGQTRAESAIFVGDLRFQGIRETGFPGGECGRNPCVIYWRVRVGTIITLPFPTNRVAGSSGYAGRSENRFEIEAGVKPDLFQKIGAARSRGERRQAEFGKKLPYFFSKLAEKAYDVLGLAAELGAQVRPLRGNPRRTGVEMTLACHIATEGDEDRGAKSKFVGAKQCRDHDIARRAQTAVGAKTDAATQAIVNENLLRFGEAEFPGVAGIFDARKRTGASATSVAGNDDVVRVCLGDARGDSADSATGPDLRLNRYRGAAAGR